MLSSYVTGLVAVVGMTVAWVAVQGAWRRAFPEAAADPDVLVGRMGCQGCTGSDCSGGRCTMEDTQIEHDGRISAAEEEIP